MGQPRHRVPVVGLVCGEGPSYRLRRQPILYVRVFSNVQIIVKINEIIIADLPVNRERRRRESKAN